MEFDVDRTYIHAKVHALRGSFLRREDYRRLLDGEGPRSSFPGLTDKDGGENYDLLKERIFRREIGKILLLVDAGNFYRDFFIGFLRLFELGNVKLLLSRFTGRPTTPQVWCDISPHDQFPRKFLTVDFSLYRLNDFFRDTYLSDILAADFHERYEMIENRIDASALWLFIAAARPFSEPDRRIISAVMLKRVLILEMLWEGRLKQYYQWADEEIREHLAPLEDLKRELSAGDEKMLRCERRKLRALLEDGESEQPRISAWEMRLERYFWSHLWTLYFREFHSASSIIAYLWLLYYQIQNLFRVVEGFRLGIDAKIQLDHIVCGV
ncbi:MAG: V-type ATPase subunit [Deltaproteobacteria bacterium]|nr:V-type ATPase subunit [Deltaproteobacteria bacterium]